MKRRTGRSTNAAASSPLNIKQSAGNNGRPFFGGGFFDAWQRLKKGSPAFLPIGSTNSPGGPQPSMTPFTTPARFLWEGTLTKHLTEGRTVQPHRTTIIEHRPLKPSEGRHGRFTAFFSFTGGIRSIRPAPLSTAAPPFGCRTFGPITARNIRADCHNAGRQSSLEARTFAPKEEMAGPSLYRHHHRAERPQQPREGLYLAF